MIAPLSHDRTHSDASLGLDSVVKNFSHCSSVWLFKRAESGVGDDRSLSPFAVALRQARLSRSLSIDDVVKAILLSDKQVLGLENDDYSYFYNQTYAALAASEYAKFLDVDIGLEGAPSRDNFQPPRLVASIDKVSGPKKRKNLFRFGYRSFFWLVLIALSSLAYVVSSYENGEIVDQAIPVDEKLSSSSELLEENRQDDQVIDTSGTTSEAAEVEWVPVASETPTEVKSDGNPSVSPISTRNESPAWDRDAKENRFFLVVNEPTYISVKDSLNTLLIDGTQQPTTGRRVIGKKPFLIVLEDPSAVEIYYLGSRIRPGNRVNPGISVVVRR